MTTKDRIKKFVETLNYGRNKFEDILGLSNGYISSKSPSISSDVIEKIAQHYPELNLEWLITGKGPMLKSTEASTNIETEEGIPEDKFYKDIIFTYQEMTKEYRKKIEYLEAELAKAAPFAGEEKKKQSKSA